ncbi:hypothetical protein T4A_11820 [Trichinella pseudospiralis]|uniref:Uncharacterized protein n=1 Tax=Trichinella pseudospiralis TaxID=6337 RepID=A0A0V1EEJ3_TRIPS|nr:hypothetical protein T4A_11820 [Trichinella pseudospiralis]
MFETLSHFEKFLLHRLFSIFTLEVTGVVILTGKPCLVSTKRICYPHSSYSTFILKTGKHGNGKQTLSTEDVHRCAKTEII